MGDASQWSKQEYQAETGKPCPITGPNGTLQTYSDWFRRDSYSAEEIEWYQWKIDRIRQTLKMWKDAIHAANPNAVLIVSAANLPALLRPDASTRWCRIADSVKSETDSALAGSRRNNIAMRAPSLPEPAADDARALGWVITRDSADFRPFHVWSGTDLAHEKLALLWAAAIMGFGGVANLDIYERSFRARNADALRGHTSLGSATAVFELGRRVSPYLAFTEPLRDVLVHVSESARDELLTRPQGIVAATRQCIIPTTNAFGVTSRAGLTTGTIDDDQLTQGVPEGTRTVIVPRQQALTAEQQTSLDNFRNSTGVVVALDDVAGWNGQDATYPEPPLLEALAGTMQVARIRRSSSGRSHGAAWVVSGASAPHSRFIVTIMNDFSGLHLGADEATDEGAQSVLEGAGPGDEDRPIDVNTPPPRTSLKSTEVRIRTDLLHSMSVSATEVVSGQLIPNRIEGEHFVFEIHDIEHLACLVIDAQSETSPKD